MGNQETKFTAATPRHWVKSPIRQARRSDLARGTVVRTPVEVFQGLKQITQTITHNITDSWHEGVYIGCDRVVDFSGNRSGSDIRIVPLSTFLYDGRIWANDMSNVDYELCAQRAESAVGEYWGYDSVNLNCRDFTHWCKTGHVRPGQHPRPRPRCG